jgi:tetratricopeptide (TPR) repeat protein
VPVGIALVTGLVFAPALAGGFVWDDEWNLLGGADYRGFGTQQLRWMLTSAYMGHYHPLTWLSWALDYRLYGADARGYHLTNVVLHALNAALVYALLRALLARARPDGGGAMAPFAAAVGALVFALHPQRVESVAWLTERRGVLSGLFVLLAVLAYVRGVTGRARGVWLGVSLATWALSLLAKAWTMTLPLVLLVLDVYPLRRVRERGWRALILEKVPYVVLGALAAGMAAYASRQAGAMATLGELSAGKRLVQALYGTIFYAWTTLVPSRLSPLYPIESFHAEALSVRAVAVSALLLTGVVLAGYRRWPAIAAAWACYLLLLAPVLGLAQSGIQFAADRYTYLAIVPLLALVTGGLDDWLQRHPRHAAGLLPLSVGVMLVLIVLTRSQIGIWADPRRLWSRVVDVYPDSHNAWHNLGLVRLGAGDAQGIADLDRAVAIAPDFAPAFNSRGAARQSLGDLPGARADLDRAIALTPTWPDPYNNRGNVRLAAGDVEGALQDYDRVLTMSPGHVRARFNRALARERAHDVQGALADIDVLIAEAPDYAYGYATRVRYRAALGDLAGALADCEQALRLLPAGSADAQKVAGYRATLEERLRAAQR